MRKVNDSNAKLTEDDKEESIKNIVAVEGGLPSSLV